MNKWLIGLGYAILIVLTAHFYAQYRFADMAAKRLILSLEENSEYINNQCVTLLGKQGFQVSKISEKE